MVNSLISFFPAHVHRLTLVNDPDGLLSSETTRAELARRGFVIIQENDPILLRRRMSEVIAPSVEHPLLIITPGPLSELPYDIWQPGYRLELSLHQYFPNLAYPVLQSLSPYQLEMLSQVAQPDAPLGRQKTIEFLLKEIFDAEPLQLSRPDQLIGWLTHYHQGGSVMPTILRDFLVERLARVPAFKEWNLAGWVSDAQAFTNDLQTQWACYVQSGGGQKSISDEKGKYVVRFEENRHLQEMVPTLVRKRFLQPVEAPQGEVRLPEWATAGLVQRDTQTELLKNLLDDLRQQLPSLSDAGWETWKQSAHQWAEINALLYTPELSNPGSWKEPVQTIAQSLDEVFQRWLQTHYALLAAQRLPRPSHVHHIPHYLAYLRGLGGPKPPRVALLVLDGMSFSDWAVIQPRWSQRNPRWQIHSDALLAQIPTITALSRYALISGLRPADFANHLDGIPSEEKKWQLFWFNQELPSNAIGFEHLALDRLEAPLEIERSRLQALCLIDDTLDRLTHNATLGTADQQSSLRLWLDSGHTPNSMPLETLISSLLDKQFTVFLTSDHGHVEASGFDQPFEGLVAQTRGKRARIYQDRNAALQVQSGFTETILWENDGLNPPDLFALMPSKRRAFAPNGEVVVTHGGVTMDEVIVPFIRIDHKA